MSFNANIQGLHRCNVDSRIDQSVHKERDTSGAESARRVDDRPSDSLHVGHPLISVKVKVAVLLHSVAALFELGSARPFEAFDEDDDPQPPDDPESVSVSRCVRTCR